MITISLPGYVNGKASLTPEKGGRATLAHYGPKSLFTPGTVYAIEGKNYLVLKNAQSQYVKGVILVHLEEINT